MKIAKPAVQADIVLSVDFDQREGILAVATSCRPGLNLGVSLEYGLTKDDARQLGDALLRWADGS